MRFNVENRVKVRSVEFVRWAFHNPKKFNVEIWVRKNRAGATSGCEEREIHAVAWVDLDLDFPGAEQWDFDGPAPGLWVFLEERHEELPEVSPEAFIDEEFDLEVVHEIVQALFKS